MTISQGSPITQTDLRNLIDASLVLIRADNRLARLGWPWTHTFFGLVDSTPEYQREVLFTPPSSSMLVSMALSVHNMDGLTTARLEAESDLAFTPAEVSVAGAGAATTTNAARYLYTNAAAPPWSTYVAQNPVLRTARAGTPMRLLLTTTNTLGPTSTKAVVTLMFRQGYQR